jgi:hypothetical protein
MEALIQCIHKNEPILIKGFFSSEDINKHIYLAQFAEVEKKAFTASYALLTEDYFNEKVETITKMQEVVPSNRVRFWEHSQGHITPWHYDGNGIDIFNISLSGSKTFYLSPPGSLKTYPLSAVAINMYAKGTHVYKLFPGDMLYIPSFWFHRVITMEDNTKNVNFSFYYTPRKISTRDCHIYKLHQALDTKMCRTYEICNIQRFCMGTNDHPSIVYGFMEMDLVYLLMILCLWIAHIIGYGNVMLTIWALVSLYFMTISNIDHYTVGIFKIMGFFMLIFTCVLFMLYNTYLLWTPKSIS